MSDAEADSLQKSWKDTGLVHYKYNIVLAYQEDEWIATGAKKTYCCWYEGWADTHQSREYLEENIRVNSNHHQSFRDVSHSELELLKKKLKLN